MFGINKEIRELKQEIVFQRQALDAVRQRQQEDKEKYERLLKHFGLVEVIISGTLAIKKIVTEKEAKKIIEENKKKMSTDAKRRSKCDL